VINTKYFYISELAQMSVLTSHYGEFHSKPAMGMYGNFLNLYGGGQRNARQPPAFEQLEYC
jgi:hypothetical protein